MKTVECCLCHAETPLATSLVVTKWAFCEDCVREMWTRVVEIVAMPLREAFECSCCGGQAPEVTRIGRFRICAKCVADVAEELPSVLLRRERCELPTRKTLPAA